MPKEYVFGKRPYFETEEGPPEQPVVAVRWDKESGDLQIVTRLLSAEVPSPEEHFNIPARYGFYVDLDRQAINNLIPILRRARNAVFGADE